MTLVQEFLGEQSLVLWLALGTVGFLLTWRGADTVEAATSKISDHYGVSQAIQGGIIAAIATSADVISHLPPDVDIDVSGLVGAEILVPTQESPFRAMSYMNDLIRQADHFRICATAVIPPQVELFHREVVKNGMSLEATTGQESLDVLASQHREHMVEALKTGRYELFITDERIPYGVVVAKTSDGPKMCISFCDGDGIAGTIANDDPPAVAWANERLDDYLEAGERISSP